MGNGILFNRRRFLQTGIGILTGLGLSMQSLAAFAGETRPERSLRLYNPHTEETLVTTYWADGEYNQSAIEEINYLLRDRRSGEVYPVDIGLIERLYLINTTIDPKCWVEVLCGYRSPETNRTLRKVNRGVSKNSLHMEGRAVDIRMSGIKAETIRDASLQLRLGGIGYYGRRQFVHIDSGEARYWRG